MVPDRRTLTVLAAVIAGMTLTSGMLLVLQPGPVAPITGVSLQSIDQSTLREPETRLFSTTEPLQPQQWQAIIIHDSGSQKGSARALNELHEGDRGGLGYHFVINNGSGERDGVIEVGFRWQRQMTGQFLEGPGADAWLQSTIGICLVGDGDRGEFTDAQMRELVWLVRQVQARFGIRDDMVIVDVGQGLQPAPMFPYAWFHDQLAGSAVASQR